MSILEDSSVYQIILSKGAKRTLLRLGNKRFGPPDAAALAALDAIYDVERLERMSERLLEVNTWAEMLATP
jgi:hypothetical protein